MYDIRSQDYTPTDKLILSGRNYILGFNAAMEQPYAIWLEDPTGAQFNGQGFPDLRSARESLFRCALNSLPTSEAHDILLACMSEQDKAIFRQEARDEVYRSDIASCLEDALDALGIQPELVPELMDQKEFSSRALDLYLQLDHSDENAALTDSLKTLIQDHYPELLPKEFSEFLKISPEKLSIVDEVLRCTAEELSSKYGAFSLESDLLVFQKDYNSPHGSRTLELSVSSKERPDGENSIQLRLYKNDYFAYTEGENIQAETKLCNVSTLERTFEIEDKNGYTWKLDLHADERLRKIGQEYIFTTDSTDKDLVSHIGQRCTIDRMLTPEESNIFFTGLMWKARFQDGFALDVFDNELRLPPERTLDVALHPEKKQQETPLQERLNNAKNQAAKQKEKGHRRTPDQDISK